ncbi:hypothetical protein QYF36_009296 [Acer negundo]|nr:hypothetical protein QYF36_009296 [Acer negundo]
MLEHFCECYSDLSGPILCPVLGSITPLFIPNSRIRPIRLIGLCASLITFFYSPVPRIQFDPSTAKSQFVESLRWLPYENINLDLAIDEANRQKLTLRVSLPVLEAKHSARRPGLGAPFAACFATTVAGENSLMVERSLAKAEVEGSSPSFRSWLRRLVVTSYLSGGLLLLVTFFACGTYSLKMACMWSRMLSISIVGALSAYPSFMPPYRLSPSISVRLDVFLLSPEVTSPDLFLLVELSWDIIGGNGLRCSCLMNQDDGRWGVLSKWASISSLGIKEEMKSRACIVEESYFVPLASKSRENRGPGIAGPSKYGDYCFHCSTIECKSRSLNCRGAALRKGIPTSISIRAKVRSVKIITPISEAVKLFCSLRSCRIFKRVGRLVSPGKPLLSGLHQVIECPTIRMRMGQGEVRDETLVDLRQSGASGGMAACAVPSFRIPDRFRH